MRRFFALPLMLIIVLSGLVFLSACGGLTSGPTTGGNSPGTSGNPPTTSGMPVTLSAAGLYADINAGTFAQGVQEYQPGYALWADGDAKRRWISLPASTKIDTSDMDHWQFPVGTKMFKEFSENGLRLETRLIERTGPGASDYFMSAYLWRADQSDADLVVDTQFNVLGTQHDVPGQNRCPLCHGGEPGRILGFSAIQLSPPAAKVTLASLIATGNLTNPPLPGTSYSPPGPPTVAAAFGYLHANCGHCHNPNGLAWKYTNQVLRLSITELTPAATQIYQTTINKSSGCCSPIRIVPGSPLASDVYVRMSRRDPSSSTWTPPAATGMGCCSGTETQMPPTATKDVDPTGLNTIQTWIQSLTP